jgi:hypothetical protein
MLTHADQTQRRFALALEIASHTPVYAVPPRSLTADSLERLAEESRS